jgi:O-methyltransferase/methyltransferase family protein
MSSPEQGVPPPFALLQMIMGSMLTQAIHVAAVLDFAGILADGPLPAAEVARRAGSDPDASERLLRTLASFGIFAETPDERFTLTPLADALRTDAPVSMRGMALLLGHPYQWEDWGHLIDSVRTGEPVLEKLRGMGGYEFLAANPDFAQVFEGGMGTLSDLETVPVAEGYDYAKFDTLVDVFGGRGAVLAEILQRAPATRGVLFDQRAEHLGAAKLLAEAGVADRVSIDTGELFGTVPAGADGYLLKHIVHEWPEAKSLEILRNVRSAIRDDGTVLLVEFVLPDGNVPHPGKLVDLWLMILMGGRERTRSQYAELLGKAGFELTRVIETASSAAIIEAKPVRNG